MKKHLLYIAIIVLFLSGCVHVETRNHFNRTLQSIWLSNNTILSTWESGSVYWHPSGLRIESEGRVIYIDPVDVIDTLPADYIFITHTHTDHLSLPDIKKIAKKETVIVCPKTAAHVLSNYTTMKVKPGDVLDIGDIKCEAVPAYNFVHQKMFGFVGFILTINGLRLYHAGDTGLISEMNRISNITVAMVPIGVGILAMNPEQAAKAVNEIKPLIAIPMHYELNKNQAEIFKRLIDKGIQVEIMEQEK